MLNNCIISGFVDEIDKDFTTQLETAKELNQSYIELRSADGINVSDFSIEDAKKYKDMLEEYNIKVSAIGSPIGKINITDDFESHFEKYKNTINVAKILDTKYIRMFSFYITDNEYEIHKPEVLKRLKIFIDEAKKNNIILLHENEKGIYGDTAQRCNEIFKELYCDNFQCTFDFANFVQVNQNTLEAYEMLKKYIKYIHVKDALKETSEVVPAGEGDGNLKIIFEKLDNDKYCGFLSLEPHLFSFNGFNKLEKTNSEKKETNGKMAYIKAYKSLKKLV